MKKLLIFLAIVLVTNGATYLLTREPAIESAYPESETVDRNEPVAEIDGEPIEFEEWMTYLETHFGKEALEALITDEVTGKISAEENISINEKIIDLEVMRMHTLYGQLPESQVEQREALWRDNIHSRLLMERLLTRDVSVSDADIDAYYQQHQGDFEFSRWIELSEIEVDSQATADAIYQALEDGADFHALAREYATTEEMLETGGYLGFYSYDSTFLTEDYKSRVDALDAYSYSEPFQNGSGYSIVYLGRDLPAITLPLADVRDYIRTELAIEQLAYLPDEQTLWEERNVEWIY
ncbi:hypothetical protein HMI01_16280 [Halolactibacillus miurensis]|uniref:peptidylprolyl isomerase n=1 Tax=Halolactibacillus miurensis TaxID=306541 RepID=A0A1I6TG44_9BACI|nr:MULTISPECIES: peptidyl-prolyl cis-trans isomerase [Halolactibacillus]GEM04640.1 hypothetical protein HMI01_16280 [Halolactibacillus miurensis]SFS88153.1 Parvulin-like peptidyl-prolyl isomerase [Halolactibacillus miurensis]